MVELLIKRDAQINVPSKVRRMEYHSHTVWFAYIYMQEERQCITALGLACHNGHKGVAELLILEGAKINYQDNVRYLNHQG